MAFVASFFAVFFATLDYSNIFAFETLLPSLAKATGAAILFWFIGFIVGDMVLKGIVEHVGAPETEKDRIEGGLLQRVQEMKKEQNPEARAHSEAAAASAQKETA